MTAVLYDEVVTAAPARKLTVVRDFETARTTTRAPAKKVSAGLTPTPSAPAATRWLMALRVC